MKDSKNILLIIGICGFISFICTWLSLSFELTIIEQIDDFARQNLSLSISDNHYTFFSNISRIGSSILLLPISVIISAFLYIKRRVFESLWFLLGTFINAITVYFLKLIIARPRPVIALDVRDSWSFPSGHSSVTTFFYGFIIILAIFYVQKLWERLLIIISSLSVILLVYWSRIYLGAHFATDIIASLSLSTSQLLVGYYFYLKVKEKNDFL